MLTWTSITALKCDHENLLALLLFYSATAVTLAQPKETNDDVAIQFAAGVATKFLDSVDRKRSNVAETYSYLEKRELPSGGSRRVPSVKEEVVAISVQAREKFGKLLSRQLIGTKVTSDRRGLPDSKFVEFSYELKFEKKDKVREFLKIKVEGEQKGKAAIYSGG